MIKAFIGALLISSFLFSKEINQDKFLYTLSYDYLKNKPKSRAKDFYSLLFLEKTSNKKEAQKIFYQLTKIKNSHIKELAKKSNDESLNEYLRCSKLSARKLITESIECSLLGYSLGKASNLSNSDKLLLSLKYKEYAPEISKMLHFMSKKRSFTTENIKDSLKLFVKSGRTYRESRLDFKLSQEFTDSLEPGYYLNKTVEYAAVSPRLDYFKRTLLGLDVNSLSAKSSFFYAMIALSYLDEKRAIEGLERARRGYTKQKYIDKVNFWLWLITKKNRYYNELKKSKDINFYTLVFREKVKLPLLKYRTSAPEVKGAKKLSVSKISDPFYWNKLLSKIRNTKKSESEKLLYDLGGKDAEPFRAIVYSHMTNYQTDYFIHPWRHHLKKLDLEYQALVLALARQESQFIPSALSTSYAIGAMQMMPFLIKHIGKKEKEETFLPDFFSISKILPYAIKHVDWLRKKYEKNPLLIAYAYNGGSGFTDRKVLAKLFKGGKYDPFLSMELVPYTESREYGKKVLANYYIYRNILKIPTTFESVFEKIK